MALALVKSTSRKNTARYTHTLPPNPSRELSRYSSSCPKKKRLEYESAFYAVKQHVIVLHALAGLSTNKPSGNAPSP